MDEAIVIQHAKAAAGAPVVGTSWKTGVDDSIILPDSEYPDWLWTLNDPNVYVYARMYVCMYMCVCRYVCFVCACV